MDAAISFRIDKIDIDRYDILILRNSKAGQDINLKIKDLVTNHQNQVRKQAQNQAQTPPERQPQPVYKPVYNAEEAEEEKEYDALGVPSREELIRIFKIKPE